MPIYKNKLDIIDTNCKFQSKAFEILLSCLSFYYRTNLIVMVLNSTFKSPFKLARDFLTL